MAGARVFQRSGCLQCHTYLGAGAQNVGAPDLTAVGRIGRTPDQFAAYVADPSRFGNEVMPRFESLGTENLRKLGVFLAASRGRR